MSDEVKRRVRSDDAMADLGCQLAKKFSLEERVLAYKRFEGHQANMVAYLVGRPGATGGA